MPPPERLLDSTRGDQYVTIQRPPTGHVSPSRYRASMSVQSTICQSPRARVSALVPLGKGRHCDLRQRDPWPRMTSGSALATPPTSPWARSYGGRPSFPIRCRSNPPTCGQQHHTETRRLLVLKATCCSLSQDLIWLIKFADAGGKEQHFGAGKHLAMPLSSRRSPLLVPDEFVLRISRGS